MTRSGVYIDGVWQVSTGRRAREVFDPWSGAVVASLADATADDVHAAVTAAVRVMTDAPLTPYERYEILSRTADLMTENAEEFARLLVSEAGKPIRDARKEVARSVGAVRLCAEEAKRIGGDVVPVDGSPGSEHRVGFTLPTPIGVVCAITAFNAPLIQLMHKVPTGLAAGCAVVAKPAERTPLTAVRFVEILEQAGLPAGWVNLLIGGAAVGDALLSDRRFAAYTFTGSAAVGEHIHRSVGLRKTLLELGNNSPSVVHRDADLDVAATSIARSAFSYAGQLCVSAQRVLVHRSVHKDLLARLADRAEAMVLGDPSSQHTDIGPMITTEAVKRARDLIAVTVADGAHLVTGGVGDDRTLAPTILDAVRPDMQIAVEEAFAPVVAIMTYEDLDHAVSLANATRYGLQAAVFTESLDVAMYLGRKLDTGTVVVNDGSDIRLDQLPFGGVKDSGLGREGIRFTIDEFITPRLMLVSTKTPS